MPKICFLCPSSYFLPKVCLLQCPNQSVFHSTKGLFFYPIDSNGTYCNDMQLKQFKSVIDILYQAIILSISWQRIHMTVVSRKDCLKIPNLPLSPWEKMLLIKSIIGRALAMMSPGIPTHMWKGISLTHFQPWFTYEICHEETKSRRNKSYCLARLLLTYRRLAPQELWVRGLLARLIVPAPSTLGWIPFGCTPLLTDSWKYMWQHWKTAETHYKGSKNWAM